LNTRFLRSIVWKFLTEELKRDDFELGISVVNEEAMTRTNECYLRHQGSTDVITFDYSDAAIDGKLAGEIFVCIDEAMTQAPHFGTTWQNELVRYIIHGVLHLTGYDDKKSAARKKMKGEEDRLMRKLAAHLKLDQITTARHEKTFAK
jgi:rRNA maturation RNase YbeY